MGYDYYVINSSDFYVFLIEAKKYNIKLLKVDIQDQYIFFYSPIYQRLFYNKMSIHFQRIKTVGFISYILLFFTRMTNLVFLLSFVLFFLFCSNCIMDIDIIGTNQKVNLMIEEYLDHYDIRTFAYKKSYEELNDIMLLMKQDFKNDIEYLNLYQIGSVFYVEYISQKKENILAYKYKNLYASKDGLIAKLDVDSGVVKVKVNDYVRKGDLLVENYIVSTQNQTSIIPVKAKVYAYTFQQYTAKKNTNKQDEAETFYELLLSIRSKINITATIDVEKVLQIKRSHSTISLKMHYTLIEDIAVEGDTSEENH